MISLWVGRIKYEAVCILARQLTKVAAMVYPISSMLNPPEPIKVAATVFLMISEVKLQVLANLKSILSSEYIFKRSCNETLFELKHIGDCYLETSIIPCVEIWLIYVHGVQLILASMALSFIVLEKSIIEMCELNTEYNWERIRILSPRMTTRSASRATAAPRGGRTGGRTGGQGNEVNNGVDRFPDFSTIITQQLQNLLPTILAQEGNTGNNQGNNRNQKGDAVNDSIQGDVMNVFVKNGRRGCSYKEFLACNPKEYDGKGGVIVYTYWIEKIESVQDMSRCGDDQKVKYTAGSFVGKALT
ncbi:hypothetical protein Tco_0870953 [Tanacetum coccineum]